MKLFHHDDHDGYLSRFWAYKAIMLGKIKRDAFDITFYEMCYEGRKEYPMDEIQKGEQIIILDYKIMNCFIYKSQ